MSLIIAQMQRCPWNSAKIVLGASALFASAFYLLHG
ncbi:hypothetical protein SAMN05444161_3665 [Rhizobiales bacterium GAS191]|nr:hypothetical protein SAMN05519103_02814 [Rhizobiales bacterium GAS113]SED64952.1 hypothetical protein SAMN05444161_3665 [Rhizobiales bacterium GAS191]SEE75275.1 hypothetical protein SAMN05519104_7347 [Rhizobiales bacterium GAS188]